MSLTNKDIDSSSHFDSGHVSVNAEDKTGNPKSETLPRRTMLLNVLPYVYYWILTTIFPHNQDSRDVEKGEILQAEAIGLELHANSSYAQPTMGHIQLVEAIGGNQTVTELYSVRESRVDEGVVQGQDAEPELYAITENQTLFEESRDEEDVGLESESYTDDQTMPEATSGRDPARGVSGENHIFPNPQIISIQVVGIWIVPTVIGVVACLIQVAVENQKSMSNHKPLSYLCFGVSVATLSVGVVLFILSITQWNNPRRDLIIKFMTIVAFGSAIVDICVLITFGFIVMQSNAN